MLFFFSDNVSLTDQQAGVNGILGTAMTVLQKSIPHMSAPLYDVSSSKQRNKVSDTSHIIPPSSFTSNVGDGEEEVSSLAKQNNCESPQQSNVLMQKANFDDHSVDSITKPDHHISTESIRFHSGSGCLGSTTNTGISCMATTSAMHGDQRVHQTEAIVQDTLRTGENIQNPSSSEVVMPERTRNEVDPILDSFSEDIDPGEITAEEIEMDKMFKEDSYPAVDEIGDAKIPEEGMIFKTKEDAFKFFALYARKEGFAIKKHTSLNSKKSNEMIKQQFVCTKQGLTNENVNVVRERRTSTTIKCSCRVKILVRQTEFGWMYKTVFLEHNHALHPTDWLIRFSKCHKSMTEQDKAFIRILHKGKLPPRKVMAIFSGIKRSFRGVGFDARDVSNMKYADKKYERNKDIENCIKRFTRLQSKIPGFSYTFEVDDSDTVRSIFWTDAMCKMNYDRYGEYVSFDTTFQTNVYNMPFAPIIGVNNHGSTVLFGIGLLKDESADTFKWLFKTFIESMGGKEPKYIITDQCRAMKKAIEELLVNTVHRFCFWHIFKKMIEKMASIAGKHKTLSEDFRSAIKNSLSVEEFESRWKGLVEKYNLTANKHLLDLWELRKYWAHAYFMDCFFPFSSSTTRSESTNSMWKDYVEHSDTILRFLDSYETIQEKCLSDLDKKKRNTSEKKPNLWGRYPLESEAAKIYTLEIYLKFRKELADNTAFNIQRTNDTDSGQSFEVIKINNYADPEFNKDLFIVEVDAERTVYSCTCKKMQRDGIQCCHVIRVVVHLGLTRSMPDSFVNPRWKRCNSDDKANFVFRLHGGYKSNSLGPVEYAIELSRVSEICSMACTTKKAYNVLQQCIDDMHMRVMAALEQDDDDEQNDIYVDNANDTLDGNDDQHGQSHRRLKDPPIISTKGRKKGQRMKSGFEKGKRNKSNMRCGWCHTLGHTKPKCEDWLAM